MINHANNFDLLVIDIDELPLVWLQFIDLLIVAHFDMINLGHQIFAILIQGFCQFTLFIFKYVFEDKSLRVVLEVNEEESIFLASTIVSLKIW